MQHGIELARRWVNRLSTQIGIRLTGTVNDRLAVDFSEAEFRDIFPQVVRHEYRFLGWRTVQEGVLDISGESFPTRLGVSTPSTPGELSGRLRSCGESSTYGLSEKNARGVSAHIMVYDGEGGRAIPLLWRPFGSIPAGIVGQDLKERLLWVSREEGEVAFSCQTEYVPNSISWNIEGTIPGDPQRWVIVIGHYDTQYVSPGANDNTASTACLAALGQVLLESGRSGGPTLSFLATGGEELDLMGSRSFVRDLVWSGEADKVMLARVRRCRWGPDGGIDSVPFQRAGLPTINTNTAGDPQTSALWHTPEDTEDRVPWLRIQDALTLFGEFLARL